MAMHLSDYNRLWPFGVVPYVIDDGDFPTGSDKRLIIEIAVSIWNDNSNLRFIPRAYENDYICFIKSDDKKVCSSEDGRKGGGQNIRCNLDVKSRDINVFDLVHEIGHAIGLIHEHSRSDRDQHVWVNYDNIDSKYAYAFDIESSRANDFGPYDYDSVMHYTRKAFAEDGSIDTLVPFGWFGSSNQGAAVTSANYLGVDARQLIFAHMDNPSGENQAYYRTFEWFDKGGINGKSGLYRNRQLIPGPFGTETGAVGIATGQINKNIANRKVGLDLVFFHVDKSTAGRNTANYRIGWTLDQLGNVSGGWSLPIIIPGLAGIDVRGGGIALHDISKSGSLDLLMFCVDRGTFGDYGYYRIGWDLDTNGIATRWSGQIDVPGPLCRDCQGANVAIADLTGSGNPDLVIFMVDHNAGNNEGSYIIGWDLDRNGIARAWSAAKSILGWFGSSCHGAGVCLADFPGVANNTMIAFFIDNKKDENMGHAYIGLDLNAAGDPPAGWLGPQYVHNFGFDAIERIGVPSLTLLPSTYDIQGVNFLYPNKTAYAVPQRMDDASGNPVWFSTENQGGDIAIADITGTGNKDAVVFFISNPSGKNEAYYRLGRNLDMNAIPASGWSGEIAIPDWKGEEDQAAGVTLADISRTGLQNDMLVFYIDNPAGENKGYYRVGMEMDAAGICRSWSDPIEIPGWFGAENQGGGIAAYDINSSGQLDLIVCHINNPKEQNHGYYRIGWDMDTAGQVRAWSDPVRIENWFGWENQGGGIAVGDVTRNGKPDLVVFYIDNPKGENQAFYQIGYDLDTSGRVSGWSRPIYIAGWFGAEDQGAGIALSDLDKDGKLEFVLFHIDNASGENHGHIRVLVDPPLV